jgi:hypothetical protein
LCENCPARNACETSSSSDRVVVFAFLKIDLATDLMKIIDEVSNIREHLDNLLELPDRMIVQSDMA